MGPLIQDARYAFGGLAVVLLLLIAWGPTEGTRTLVTIVIVTVLAVLGLAVLRRQTAREVHRSATDSLMQSDDTPPPAPATPAKPSLRARAEALTARGQALFERLEGERPSHASVEIGFRSVVRDRQIAGGVLGGGMAYRLFFWTLALTVLVSAGLGFAAHAGSNVDTAVSDAGLTSAVASSVSEAAEQSDAGRWWLLVIGVYLTLWFSWSLFRALRLVHAAAWQVTPQPIRNAPRALGCVLAAPVIAAAATVVAGWIRAHSPFGTGLLATLAVGVAFAFLWLAASRGLPAAPGTPWTAFLPGAVLLGIGLEALHLFTVYFLANKLASSSALYGSLGLAGTMLFFLYLIGTGRDLGGRAQCRHVGGALRANRRVRPDRGGG